MKRAHIKRELYLNRTFPKVHNLNKSSSGYTPCWNEAPKIKRKINESSLNEIKIDEIKKIVNSLFENKKYKIKN